MSTLFNFDIPITAAEKTCSLIFLFPKQADLVTSSFIIDPTNGVSVNFAALAGPADVGTTYANAAAVRESYGAQNLAPGNGYTITSFACPVGQRIGYKMSLVGGNALSWFQDYNPSP